MILIEIGGLGYLSTIFLFIVLANKRIGLKQRITMAQGLGIVDYGGIVRTEIWVIRNSLIVQGIGAVLLMFGFLPHYGWKRAIYAESAIPYRLSATADWILWDFQARGPGS